MLNLLNTPALLVLDVQKGFDNPYWGERNNPQAEENILLLQTEWRKRNWPIMYSQHLSKNPSSPLHPSNSEGVELKELNKPLENETVVEKNVNSAFIGTNLEGLLREKNISTVVITGLTTQHCISTSVRMSGNLGFNTFVVSDGTAAFGSSGLNEKSYTADQVHDLELSLLNKEFATVVTTGQILNFLQTNS